MISESFPDYDLSTLPPIPSDWRDVSWHHDVCPSWQYEGFQIFIDHEEQSEREFANKRFSIIGDKPWREFLSSDDWLHVQTFFRLLKIELPPIENFHTESDLCAIYDKFLSVTALPAESADELAMHDLPPNVSKWLSEFIIAWEELEEENRDWDKYAAQKTGTR